MQRIAVIGMLTHDTIWLVRSFQAGQPLVGATEVVECLGGKGFVAAASMVHCGTAPRLLALTSPHTSSGDWDLRGVAVSAALRLQTMPSRTWTLLRDGEDVLTVVHETGSDHATPEVVASEVRRELSGVDGVYLTTESIHVVAPALETLASHPPQLVVVNLNAATLGDSNHTNTSVLQHLELANLLIVNVSEERQLLDRLRHNDWTELNRSGTAPHLRHIVVTLGWQGHRWAQRPFQRWRSTPAHSHESVRCTLGAGDTFAGALTAHLLVTGDLDGGLERASQAAAQKVAMLRSSL